MANPNLNDPRAGFGKIFLPMILLCSVCALIFLKMGFVFMVMAMLPSLTAYFTDNMRGRPTFRTVFACNLASAIHPVADLYSRGLRMSYERFSEALSEPRMWLFIYSGAAAGWGLLYCCRFVAHFGVEAYHEYQLMHLAKQQEWLVGEWGSGIKPEEEQ